MNNPKISQALTSGLLAGYGGKTEFKTINREGFELKSSHFENGGILYHDEWISGGGQEIVKVGDHSFTRVYAGKVLDASVDVIPKLIYFIQQLKDKTRLFSNCQLSEGDWQYQYKIIDTECDITSAKETIEYKNKIVFVHYFVMSPC